MNIFTWLAKVTFYSESEEKNIVEYGIYYGDTLSEISKQLDCYYGNDSIEVTITLIKDGYFVFENEELAKLILQEKE